MTSSSMTLSLTSLMKIHAVNHNVQFRRDLMDNFCMILISDVIDDVIGDGVISDVTQCGRGLIC